MSGDRVQRILPYYSRWGLLYALPSHSQFPYLAHHHQVQGNLHWSNYDGEFIKMLWRITAIQENNGEAQTSLATNFLSRYSWAFIWIFLSQGMWTLSKLIQCSDFKHAVASRSLKNLEELASIWLQTHFLKAGTNCAIHDNFESANNILKHFANAPDAMIVNRRAYRRHNKMADINFWQSIEPIKSEGISISGIITTNT